MPDGLAVQWFWFCACNLKKQLYVSTDTALTMDRSCILNTNTFVGVGFSNEFY